MYASKSKVWHKHVKENRSCVRFKIWIWANTFSRKKKEFPYTAVIVSINRCFLRELKQRRRRRQQERHKSNWFRLAKQQLCTCNTRFCIFFQFAVTARLRRETAYFTFFEGREHRTTAFYLFSWISIQLQKKLPTFDEMNEME